MANAVSKMSLSKKKRKLFLQMLAKTGQVNESARYVGYKTAQYLHLLRREDEEFAEQWDLAIEAAKSELEGEAIRRARDGVLKPKYYKGVVVGYETEYSDTLLMFVLKKLDPAYRDTGKSGDTNINFGIAVLPMQAKDEKDWESRAIGMHEGQQTIELEAKPIENNLARVRRGD